MEERSKFGCPACSGNIKKIQYWLMGMFLGGSAGYLLYHIIVWGTNDWSVYGLN